MSEHGAVASGTTDTPLAEHHLAEPGTGDAALAHTASADVATDAPQRYAKQLASHFGRKIEVVSSEAGDELVFEMGRCLLVADPQAAVLRLRARAGDPAGLARLTDVVGGHLERFGQRNELTVTWRR